MGIALRDVLEADVAIFFEQQLDPEANSMAAFTAENPADEAAFHVRWNRILKDDTNTTRTILMDGQVAGHVASFEREGDLEVTYWLGKAYWGQGIATRALTLFLDEMSQRPVYARAAKDHRASLRVLEKCGFTICGEDSGYASARGTEVEEFVLRLDASE